MDISASEINIPAPEIKSPASWINISGREINIWAVGDIYPGVGDVYPGLEARYLALGDKYPGFGAKYIGRRYIYLGPGDKYLDLGDIYLESGARKTLNMRQLSASREGEDAKVASDGRLPGCQVINVGNPATPAPHLNSLASAQLCNTARQPERLSSSDQPLGSAPPAPSLRMMSDPRGAPSGSVLEPWSDVRRVVAPPFGSIPLPLLAVTMKVLSSMRRRISRILSSVQPLGSRPTCGLIRSHCMRRHLLCCFDTQEAQERFTTERCRPRRRLSVVNAPARHASLGARGVPPADLGRPGAEKAECGRRCEVVDWSRGCKSDPAKRRAGRPRSQGGLRSYAATTAEPAVVQPASRRRYVFRPGGPTPAPTLAETSFTPLTLRALSASSSPP